jgi:hypothetical protein
LGPTVLGADRLRLTAPTSEMAQATTIATVVRDTGVRKF